MQRHRDGEGEGCFARLLTDNEREMGLNGVRVYGQTHLGCLPFIYFYRLNNNKKKKISLVEHIPSVIIRAFISKISPR